MTIASFTNFGNAIAMFFLFDNEIVALHNKNVIICELTLSHIRGGT